MTCNRYYQIHSDYCLHAHIKTHIFLLAFCCFSLYLVICIMLASMHTEQCTYRLLLMDMYVFQPASHLIQSIRYKLYQVNKVVTVENVKKTADAERWLFVVFSKMLSRLFTCFCVFRIAFSQCVCDIRLLSVCMGLFVLNFLCHVFFSLL